MIVKKRFTPAQANRTLPLVRRIVADILERGRELRALAAKEDADPERVEDLEFRVYELMKELESIGCHYKDWGFETGLVDFPAELGGRTVLLCWRSDEERVAWYHPIDTGFAGRTPIPSELLEGEP